MPGTPLMRHSLETDAEMLNNVMDIDSAVRLDIAKELQGLQRTININTMRLRLETSAPKDLVTGTGPTETTTVMYYCDGNRTCSSSGWC